MLSIHCAKGLDTWDHLLLKAGHSWFIEETLNPVEVKKLDQGVTQQITSSEP